MDRLIGDPNALIGHGIKGENLEVLCCPNSAAAQGPARRGEKRVRGRRTRGEGEAASTSPINTD